MKITTIAAARCHILKQKMHQILFRLGLRPRLRHGSLQRSSDALAGYNGKGGDGKGREGKVREEWGG